MVSSYITEKSKAKGITPHPYLIGGIVVILLSLMAYGTYAKISRTKETVIAAKVFNEAYDKSYGVVTVDRLPHITYQMVEKRALTANQAELLLAPSALRKVAILHNERLLLPPISAADRAELERQHFLQTKSGKAN